MVSWKLLISSLVLQAAMANSHAASGGKHRTRSLSHCDEVLKQRGFAKQMASRRGEKINKERKKRNIDEKGVFCCYRFRDNTAEKCAYLVHQNATLLPNNTLQLNAGNISHVGQIFFDQDLINLVDTVEPYSSNTNEMVENMDDGVFYVEADGMDPVARYTFIGDTASEGLMAWTVFGIDTDANNNDVVQAASYYGEDGGEANAEYNFTKLGAIEQVPSSFSGLTTVTTTVSV